jgi:DNA-binding MarR family transcriptional regulator
MHNFFHFARDNNLSMPQMGALFQIQHRKSKVTDLGENLKVSAPAASQMLEKLVQQGFIIRSEDPADRRAKHIVLTEKGNQILKEGILARQSWTKELAATMTEEEKETVLKAISLLLEKTKQFQELPNEKHPFPFNEES